MKHLRRTALVLSALALLAAVSLWPAAARAVQYRRCGGGSLSACDWVYGRDGLAGLSGASQGYFQNH